MSTTGDRAGGSGPVGTRARSFAGLRPWPTFPMPNDVLNGRIVVASVVYTDDTENVATALLLNQTPPFFSVVHVFESEIYEVLEVHENIVPAVDAYKEWGGDY